MPSFKHLGNEECLGIHGTIVSGLHFKEKFAVSRNKTGFQQARLDGDVVSCFLDTFFECTDTVSNGEPK